MHAAAFVLLAPAARGPVGDLRDAPDGSRCAADAEHVRSRDRRARGRAPKTRRKSTSRSRSSTKRRPPPGSRSRPRSRRLRRSHAGERRRGCRTQSRPRPRRASASASARGTLRQRVDDPDIALERVTEAVVVIGQEPAGVVECDEVLVGVLGGPCRALRGRAEPEAALVGLEPRRAAPAAVTEPVDEGVLDRQDPLLPARRPRRDAACLGAERVVERVVERAKVDLDRRDAEFQVFADAAQRYAGSTGASRGHSGGGP